MMFRVWINFLESTPVVQKKITGACAMLISLKNMVGKKMFGKSSRLSDSADR
jgi:hypothetical protein